jgi:hypothetical protein
MREFPAQVATTVSCLNPSWIGAARREQEDSVVSGRKGWPAAQAAFAWSVAELPALTRTPPSIEVPGDPNYPLTGMIRCQRP